MNDNSRQSSGASDPRQVLIKIAGFEKMHYTLPYNAAEREALLSYCSRVLHAADTLNIEIPKFPIKSNIDDKSLMYCYNELRMNIEKIRLDLELELSGFGGDYVRLDDAWRTKIRSYIHFIRDIIQTESSIENEIRLDILKKLDAFASEVERRQTRVQILTDLFVGLCEGVSLGANKLNPAMKLAERLIGSVARLRRSERPKQLPSPESLALPPPEIEP